PNSGPISVPVTLAVCNVPKTFPAVFFGVCVEINACDIGLKHVNIRMKKRNINNWKTDVANPINKTDKPKPVADIIKIFLRPYLSPIFPHIGEKINAVTNVTPKNNPDHVCT